MPMLEGQVAAILNEREMVINIGEDAGVKRDMIFRVLDKNVPVKDPKTGEVLGVEKETAEKEASEKKKEKRKEKEEDEKEEKK